MISHALTIVVNELNRHLLTYAAVTPPNEARLGNLAEGIAPAGASRDMLVLSVVNTKEERSLKNLPNYVRNEAKLTATYENPPVFLNFYILLTATHESYLNALSLLSRGIRFFQFQNVFTPDTVAPDSITQHAPPNPLDQLAYFKLIFDFYSPTMEEVNQLWGTLGSKQYPFVLYTLRMLDLEFRAVQSEGKLITEITRNLHHKQLI